MSKYTDPQDEMRTILPEGFIHARIESVEISGEGDDERIENIVVVDHNTGNEIFIAEWADCCGDCRGFPSCLASAMYNLLFEMGVSVEDEAAENPDGLSEFRLAAAMFNISEEVHYDPQFVVDKRGTPYSKMTHKGIRFGGWIKGWEPGYDEGERDADIDEAIRYLRTNAP